MHFRFRCYRTPKDGAYEGTRKEAARMIRRLVRIPVILNVQSGPS